MWNGTLNRFTLTVHKVTLYFAFKALLYYTFGAFGGSQWAQMALGYRWNDFEVIFGKIILKKQETLMTNYRFVTGTNNTNLETLSL